ncbi:uncharacterized protein LOC124316077 [Daphnia pulicaria]|uniref:uncharacterized protein LOC124316077 n=1 Tax=Daphnia pulicaria TaxID=35523 RepID=UPI001EEBF24B|nr:uncharacterized protein LOC124316077 [Daphnia pulicaria]
MAERNDVDDEGQDDLAWVDEGDILADALTVEEPVDDSFNFPNQVCSHCDGYYGPCFGQHTCTTCHLFLFPDNINQPPEANFSEHKTDDDDSGNDEPSDLPTDFKDIGFCGFHGQNSSHPALSPAAPRRAEPFRWPVAPLKIDRLAEQLSLLSTPRLTDSTLTAVQALPPELLIQVFSHLDDISLWSASKVCKRWQQLVEECVTNDQWNQFTFRRWPLFRPNYTVAEWAGVFANLVDSSPCLYCLHRSNVEEEGAWEPSNHWRNNRLCNEWRIFCTDPPEGIRATPLDRAWSHWQASITGPHSSPYEGGVFYLHVQIPHSYPIRPPSVRFATKIFHPNISRHGDIGLDCIQHNWSLALTIAKVLISIQSLLTDPFCAVAMETDVAEMYTNQRARFNAVARNWTSKYAMNDVRRPC